MTRILETESLQEKVEKLEAGIRKVLDYYHRLLPASAEMALTSLLSGDSDPGRQEEKVVCQQHGQVHDGPFHGCPFEVRDNPAKVFSCQCCDECTQDCRENI